MPMLIKQPDMEKRLQRHAKAGPLPSNKTHMTIAIVNAVLTAAEAKGANVRDILNGLTDQGHKPRAA